MKLGKKRENPATMKRLALEAMSIGEYDLARGYWNKALFASRGVGIRDHCERMADKCKALAESI